MEALSNRKKCYNLGTERLRFINRNFFFVFNNGNMIESVIKWLEIEI